MIFEKISPKNSLKLLQFFSKMCSYIVYLKNAYILAKIMIITSTLGSVARWYNFKPKILILEGLAMDNIVILGPLCLLYGQLVYFIATWYILW
jgi:hypothetical protein